MSATPRPAKLDPSEAAVELIRRTMPIRRRRELLTVLATFSQEQLGIETCAIALLLPGKDSASVVCANTEIDYRDVLLSEGETSLAAQLENPLRETFPPLAEMELSPIALAHQGEVLGSIFVPGKDIERPVWFDLIPLLIRQLQEIESAQPNGIGFDWFRQRKLESLVEFSAGAGHEINNPVAAISGRVQLLLKEERNPTRKATLANIGANALRISQMIGDAMQFAEPPPLYPSDCELGEAVNRVLEKLQARLKEQGTEVKIVRPRDVIVRADQTQLDTLLAELFTNSLNALGKGGIIRVRISVPEDSSQGFALLEVADNGPGLTEQDRRHLFDPFYSGRQAGRGLGFGLCKCWRIVTRHGGAISVDSVPWVETVFRVQWPVASQQTPE